MHLQAEPVNPSAWAYYQHFVGREVNIVKYNSMMRRYMDHEAFKQLENTCRITQHIAVHSAILKRRTRAKYPNQRIAVGRMGQVFYMFPRNSIPLDIYCLLGARENDSEKYVYLLEN
ncbi:hypothetical protein J6TS7_54800 [Paenibacillus dendritiformis]|uniref:hypothetical protein n=1 Tax=Paenibacillus dendritiformis TaxID=130049 RepID=UPI001B0CDF38|nr:hypothetical protein [Paenibacillus dendritiformis]GIO81870.1 hypothetical protein J6TS7_54800 [Paenibacillus dendritiformis]